MKLQDRLLHAWNAFNSGTAVTPLWDRPVDSNAMATRRTTRRTTSSSFTSAVYNRIALDVAATTLEHVKEDPKTEDRTVQKTGLNYCLTVEANIDQTNLAFIHDVVYSMFDEGQVAVVPVDTSTDPKKPGVFDVDSMRVGRILEFRTRSVRVRVYNDKIGRNQDIWVPKASTAIIENPLYAVINAPNSTLQRLISKMNLMDNFEEMAASGHLDVLIHLPYAVRTELQVKQAEKRMKQIEDQLEKGKYGIAYLDHTEKVTQLNRAAQNQLLEVIKNLTDQFYNQLGLTQNVFNGTASETEMKNYYSRSIDPIVDYIVAEYYRKFLTKTARTQGHKIVAYRDNFRLVSAEQIINLGDTFRRNQIATSNEIRKLVGFKPSNDPLADELANPNLTAPNRGEGPAPAAEEEEVVDEGGYEEADDTI